MGFVGVEVEILVTTGWCKVVGVGERELPDCLVLVRNSRLKRERRERKGVDDVEAGEEDYLCFLCKFSQLNLYFFSLI